MPDNLSHDPIEQGRPVFHFTAPSNWLNDPNGLVYVDGAYHMFYQHHPHDNTFGPQHWGHASSPDLVSWRHHEIALAPDDLGMIFSGSAVIDSGNTAGFGAGAIVAVFTHHLADGVERQSLAFSTDSGTTFHKYVGNPVLESPDGVPDFRDPKVFRWTGDDGDETWVMVLAVGVEVWIYISDDLIEWELASQFSTDGHSGRVWECPDLFELRVANGDTKKWVLAIGVDSADLPHLYGTRYFVGEFDGKTFTHSHTDVHWADHGADFYAAQSWSSAPDDRKVWIGWMNNWGYARETPTEGWRGAMSVPRELGLLDTGDGIRLTQAPVRELERKRRAIVRRDNVTLEVGDDLGEGVRGVALDIDATVNLDRSTASELRISVRIGEDESTDIVLDLAESTLSVDRFRSGRHLIHRSYAGSRLVSVGEKQGMLDIRVLVDATSLEVFAGHGLVAITEQIFPSASSDGVAIEAVDGVVVLTSLEISGL
ncbi:MAG: glycoside hydrolase family 32 protein [Acidimicrobiia bacterium]|nr:glycoside hydrolase family 32 protein [Acidimicrobiia bacterium]